MNVKYHIITKLLYTVYDASVRITVRFEAMHTGQEYMNRLTSEGDQIKLRNLCHRLSSNIVNALLNKAT